MSRRLCVLMGLVLLAGCAANPPPSRQYRVWVANSGRHKKTKDQKERCYGVMFALATGVDPVRLQINGKEQLLDTAWTTEWETVVGTKLTRWFEFYDPITGEKLACRTGYISCYEDASITNHTSCDVAAVDRAILARRQGPPHLNVRYPPVLLPGTAGPYAARVTIRVEVLGEINEKWYCPEIKVIWPDRTRTIRESDCDPWDGSQAGQLQMWAFRRAFAIGNHKVEVRLSKAGRLIATETVRITVRGVPVQ